MSSQLLRKYMDIVTEANELRKRTRLSKAEAGYVNYSRGDNKCEKCVHFSQPGSCEIVEGLISPSGWCTYFEEGTIQEKWGKSTVVNPAERGKYKGKTLADLHKAYNALKASGPHPKDSPEYGRMHELAFAIRAKTGWGKV